MKKIMAILLLCVLAMYCFAAMGETVDGKDAFWDDPRWTSPEAREAIRAYRQVTEKETTYFFCMDDRSDASERTFDLHLLLLSSFSWYTHRALLDMDGDGVPEMAFQESYLGYDYAVDYLILNYADGQVYGRRLDAWNLKDDGAFEYAYYKGVTVRRQEIVSENGNTYETISEVYDADRVETVTHVDVGSAYADEKKLNYGFYRLRLDGAKVELTPCVYSELKDGERIYMVDGEPVDFDAFAAAMERESARPEPQWQYLRTEYWVNDAETAALFQQAARNEIPVRYSAYYDGMEMDAGWRDMTLDELMAEEYGEGFAWGDFVLADLDMDMRPEMVLEVQTALAPYIGRRIDPFYYIVLKAENGAVYAHQFVYRAMNNLKIDGTFSFSSGAMDSGYGRAWFHGPRHGIVQITWSESGADMETVYYYVNGAPGTEAEFGQAMEAQRKKGTPRLHSLSEYFIVSLPLMLPD